MSHKYQYEVAAREDSLQILMFKKAEFDRQKHHLTRLINYWKEKAREARESVAASSEASASLAMDREQ